MASYNRIILAGNLTKDPEIRYITSGSATVRFSLAVNRKRKNKDDEVLFVEIVAWEKLAEVCNEYLKKGSSVLVEGRLVIRAYEDNEGAKRKVTEVVIDNMQMLDSKAEASAQSTSRKSASEDEGGFEESDIPF